MGASRHGECVGSSPDSGTIEGAAWTPYRLAKELGMTEPTINRLVRRKGRFDRLSARLLNGLCRVTSTPASSWNGRRLITDPRSAGSGHERALVEFIRDPFLQMLRTWRLVSDT